MSIWKLAFVLAALVSLTAFAQQRPTYFTPGTGVKAAANHSVFLYDPYAWVFGDNDLAPVIKKYVGTGTDGTTITSGQQYSYKELREAEAPTDDAPAKICTARTFRDLIHGNKKDVGVLVVSSHGGDKEIAVEAFASEEKMHEQYLRYTIPSEAGGKPEFTKEEIEEGTTRNGPAIFATEKFVVDYRQLDGAFVYIDACSGESLRNAFTGEIGKPGYARVAMGPQGCVGQETSHDYAERFFADLDGQPRSGRSDETRLELRAVQPAVMAENMVKDSEMFLLSLSGGDTTLAPRVREEPGSFGLPCPIKGGDTIRIRLDTYCDKRSIPDIETTLSIGAPKWVGKYEILPDELQIPVTGDENYTAYKFTLKGGKLKSAENAATLDGNTNPPKVEDGKGVNAIGPANSKESPDDYLVEYQDNCKRVH